MLRALSLELPQRAWLTRDDANRITGYCFAQAQRIGPWAATQASDAERLLLAALSATYGDAPAVTMPQQNTSALSLMAQHDFHYVQAAQHMRRGGARHPSQRTRILLQVNRRICVNQVIVE
jgi:hypothetical protein